jgi:hypothetical protein
VLAPEAVKQIILFSGCCRLALVDEPSSSSGTERIDNRSFSVESV